ncbi:MAG: hypothetical protein VST67_02315 [Nitrospirota bacterium]|nr:hypothetical protein [Nitrospirota bacterium]
MKRAQAKYPDIDEIELRLSNYSVLEYSDAKLYEGIISRSKPCQDAVAAREAKGETVYTVLRVLKADVTYHIIGKDRVRHKEGKLSQKVLEGLKVELGGSSISTFGQTIQGSALHWGLKPDIIAVETLTDAVATDAVSPDAVASDAASPDVVATDAASPDAVASDAVSADVVATDAASPDVVAQDAASPDVVASELLKAPRLTEAQRSSIIKRAAILSYGKSDADRLK